MTVRTVRWALLFVLASATGSFAGGYSDDDHPWDDMSVRLGGFAMRFDTSARVDSTMGSIGTDLDLEADTNLDRDTVEIRLDGHVRFGKRHRLDYGVLSIRRNATRTIDQQIEFRDVVFDINSDLSTRLQNDLYKVAYRYDAVRRDRWDLGVSVGLSAFRIGLDLEATAAGGGPLVAEDEDFVAPIPTIGVHADIELARNWYFRAGGEFFDISIDDRQGDLLDVRGAVDWYPFRHWGFGIGFNRVRLGYESHRLPNVDVTYVYSGAMVYASYVR
ncbi:MAG: hypothetical protein OES25_03745 [Acidobacteriota bacterium]|nr:hypothetical protein [Acidobacteriota bacterium]